MSNQLKIGALLSYANLFFTLIIGLIYTPIMIRLLGQSEYGLYSLIGALIGYLSILDMGLGNAIIRYTAKNRATGDKNSEAILNGMFLLLYLAIGILTVIVGSILYYNIDNMFYDTLTKDELGRAKIMTILLILNFALSFPLSVFASVMQAYERFVFLKLCSIFRVVLNPIIVLPLLYMGYGSVMMVVISTILNIGCLLINVYYCYRYLNISFRFNCFDFLLLKEIAVYSFFIFLNIITDKIYWSTGQFILGMVAGTTSVAVYAIAMQFVTIYIMFSTSISGIMLPKVTIMVANRASASELTELMIKIGRIQYIIIGYIFSLFVLCGKQFIYLWAGEAYSDAYVIIAIIMFAIGFPLIQNTGISILQAKNLNKFRMILYTIVAMLNIVISIPLAKQYGSLGCAIATAGAQLIANIFIINAYYHYKIGLDIPLFWRSILKMSLPVIILLTFGVSINHVFSQYTWTNLFFQVGIFSLVYAVAMVFVGMNYSEKKMIEKPLQLLKKKIISLKG